MTKQDYISYKIKKIKEENPKMSQSQVAVVAYSHANKRYQDGGYIYPQQDESAYGLYNYLSPSQQQQISPYFNPAQQSTVPPTEMPNISGTNTYNPFADLNYVNQQNQQVLNSNLGISQDVGANRMTEQQTQTNTTVQNQTPNPYTGVNLETALFSLGRSLNYDGENKTANTIRGGAAAGKILLGGARTLLSGAGYQNQNDYQQKNFFDNLYNSAPTYQALQEGGTVTNGQIMTGAFITDSLNPSVEVEKNEQILNAQTGDIQKVVGESHERGGVKTDLPQGSKVLSDHTKIGAAKAKLFRKEFDIRTKASDTYASIMDKYNKKIGWKDLISAEEDTIENIENQQDGEISLATQDINMAFLSEKMQEIEADKVAMKELQQDAFNKIFEHQEGQKPNKKEQQTEMQMGGQIEYPQEILDLASQYKIAPERVGELIKMQGGGSTPNYYITNPYSLNEYGNQPFGSADYLAGNVATPEEAQSRIQQNTSLYPYLLQDSGLSTEVNPANVLSFQKGYNGLTNAVSISAALNSNLSPELKQQIIEQAKNESFVENGGVRGFDSTLGNFTSSRGGFAMPYLTAAERTKYPNIKNLGDIVDENNKIKPEYADLANSTLIENTIKAAGRDALNIGVLDIPEAAAQTETTPEGQIVNNQTVTNYTMPNLPVDFILPPSPASPVYKSDVTLSRIDSTKISAEPNLIEASRQMQAASQALGTLPDSQATASIAALLGQTQNTTNAAISNAEQVNAQSAAQAQLYNAQQSDKQQLLNEQFAKTYEAQSYAAQSNTGKDLQAYFQNLNQVQRQNYADVRDTNLINQLYPNFKINDGQNIQYVDNGNIVTIPTNLTTAQYNALSPKAKEVFMATKAKSLAQGAKKK